MLSEKIKEQMLQLLERELVPAMGCTEPIALAFAGAKAREVLGEEPVEAAAYCSGNIIKNVRCVTIPNSGCLVGIEAAVTLGVEAGDADAGMEVLAKVTQEQRKKVQELLKKNFCRVELLESPYPLHIRLVVRGESHEAEVEICSSHTNIVLLKRDGQVLFQKEKEDPEEASEDFLNLKNIKEFADTVPLSWVQDMIERQIRYNMDIAKEGLKGEYGLGIGKIIKEAYPDSIGTKMKAWAAAASEARMGGCDLPVIINSGSGNQGIASSVPVIVYGEEKGATQEKLYRGLVFSALLTIWQKSFIGRLSAFCGAVSAACASGAAMTYLDGGSLEEIKMTIYNTLADTPGIICDGAKVSCAAKIASSLDAAYMAHNLAARGKSYQPNTGILKEDVQETVSCVGYIGREGMRQTDLEILRLMLES